MAMNYFRFNKGEGQSIENISQYSATGHSVLELIKRIFEIYGAYDGPIEEE